MAREYRHLQMYEEEILELREQGLTQREIAARFGVSYEKMHDFFKRYNRKQRQLAAGIEIRPKGRPPKDYEVTENMKIKELKYIIARKDSKIKRLEMENELMRDFLSLTERK